MTRNGKSTLSETVAYILNDYARTIQLQTLSRRPSDGSSASPDIARLKGGRVKLIPFDRHFTPEEQDNSYRPLNSKNFVGELRRRYVARHDGRKGNVVENMALSWNPLPPDC